MKENRFEISNFVCPECANKFPIPRPKSMRRGKRHVKDLWCPFCKKTVKTIEYKPKDLFVTMSGEVLY